MARHAINWFKVCEKPHAIENVMNMKYDAMKALCRPTMSDIWANKDVKLSRYRKEAGGDDRGVEKGQQQSRKKPIPTSDRVFRYRQVFKFTR